jgi:hypothetical protein
VSESLIVTSNVARDMLATADEFGSVPKMVVEYASNGLDNPDDPTQPVTVHVEVRRYGSAKTVTITDDGCGMDDTALREFFVMHRENAQRQRGRRARGRFGTGKSAGFGVGTSVLIDTVHDHHHWRVELTSEELRVAATANRPPRPFTRTDGEPTDAPNGTTVTVTGIRKAATSASIANELRRRLGRQLESHRVYVDGERVHLQEPQAAHTWLFSSLDDKAAAAVLGSDLTCTVRAVASGETVDEAIRGVVVTSRDVPVGQYQASGDLANRIYGLCEVPALDEDTSTPGPFTDRRDLTLNLDNDLAAAADAWVRRCLEAATQELHAHERERLQRARDAELQSAATRAEAVLNEHYRTDFRSTAGTSRSSGAGLASGTGVGDLRADDDGSLVEPNPDGPAGYQPDQGGSSSEPAIPSDDKEASEAPNEDGTSADGNSERSRPRDPLGDGRGEPVAHPGERRRRRSGGGFVIDYSNAGAGAPRAAFYESELTIVINLDHPLLAAVHGDRDLFQGLAFTVAAEEYAQATATQLLATKQLEDAYEALQYERTTMDKLSRAFAGVFSTLAAVQMSAPRL